MERATPAPTLNIIGPDEPSLNASSTEPIVTREPKAKAESTKPVFPCASSGDGVRVVSIGEWKEVAASLAESFADDDVAKYFIDTPDRAHWTEEQKWDLHVSILEYVTYAHLLKGLVTTVGDDYAAVALWMPPGKNMDDTWTMLRSGMWRLSYKLSAEGKQRFFSEFLPLLHSTKHAALGPRDDTSWYLVYIGTKASGRGKGYARKLIEHVTRRADEEKRACYLESSNPVNPIIYKKLGFELERKIYLQRAERHVELDIMIREPKGEDGRKDSAVDLTSQEDEAKA